MRRVETNTTDDAGHRSNVAKSGGADSFSQPTRADDMRLAQEMTPDNAWHLDKKVPISLIAMMTIQCATFVWWAATTSSRIDTLEKQVSASSWQAEKIIRIEERVTSVQTTVSEVKELLQERYRRDDNSATSR